MAQRSVGSLQWPHIGRHFMACSTCVVPHHHVGRPRQDRPSGAEAVRSGV